MKHKDIRYRRHQRNRLISKRLTKLRNSWGGTWGMIPGRLHKWNMACSCWMCSKCSKTWYAGHKRSELRKLLREQDIE